MLHILCGHNVYSWPNLSNFMLVSPIWTKTYWLARISDTRTYLLCWQSLHDTWRQMDLTKSLPVHVTPMCISLKTVTLCTSYMNIHVYVEINLHSLQNIHQSFKAPSIILPYIHPGIHHCGNLKDYDCRNLYQTGSVCKIAKTGLWKVS